MTIVALNNWVHVKYKALHMGAPNDAINAIVQSAGPDCKVVKKGDEVLVGHKVGSPVISGTPLDWILREEQIMAVVLP